MSVISKLVNVALLSGVLISISNPETQQSVRRELNDANIYVDYFVCEIVDLLPYVSLLKDTLYDTSLIGANQKVNILCEVRDSCYGFCSGFVSDDNSLTMFFSGKLFYRLRFSNDAYCFNMWQPCISDSIPDSCSLLMNDKLKVLLHKRYKVNNLSSCKYLIYLSEPFWVNTDSIGDGSGNYDLIPVVGEGILLCPEDNILIVDEGFIGVVLRCKSA